MLTLVHLQEQAAEVAEREGPHGATDMDVDGGLEHPTPGRPGATPGTGHTNGPLPPGAAYPYVAPSAAPPQPQGGAMGGTPPDVQASRGADVQGPSVSAPGDFSNQFGSYLQQQQHHQNAVLQHSLAMAAVSQQMHFPGPHFGFMPPGMVPPFAQPQANSMLQSNSLMQVRWCRLLGLGSAVRKS